MRGALRAGHEPGEAGSAAQHPAPSARLSSLQGFDLKVGTRKSGSNVIAYLRRDRRRHAFVARILLEFTGAKPHLIKPLTRKALAMGGVAFSSVQHPGFKPKPFMRPALDTQRRGAVVAAAEYMKQRLATKEGLDTSGYRDRGGA
jgi:hypothetical protein